MQATLTQKVQILQALYGYVEGQLVGAQDSVQNAEEDEDDECGTATGHAQDAADILQVAIEFAEHGNMQQMLQDVYAHDTLVREDVCEGLQDCGAWGALQTLL